MTLAQIESVLHDHLGVEQVIWLDEGHYDDFSTDGHIDDIAHFLAPARVILHAPPTRFTPTTPRAWRTRGASRATPDARGRTVEVVEFDTGAPDGIPYLTCTSATAA